MTKTSKGFRLSAQALKHLAHVQKRTGLTQTAVIEMALAMLALGLTEAITATPPQPPTGAAAHVKRKESAK